jgi:hypothetical protein
LSDSGYPDGRDRRRARHQGRGAREDFTADPTGARRLRPLRARDGRASPSRDPSGQGRRRSCALRKSPTAMRPKRSRDSSSSSTGPPCPTIWRRRSSTMPTWSGWRSRRDAATPLAVCRRPRFRRRRHSGYRARASGPSAHDPFHPRRRARDFAVGWLCSDRQPAPPDLRRPKAGPRPEGRHDGFPRHRAHPLSRDVSRPARPVARRTRAGGRHMVAGDHPDPRFRHRPPPQRRRHAGRRRRRHGDAGGCAGARHRPCLAGRRCPPSPADEPARKTADPGARARIGAGPGA